MKPMRQRLDLLLYLAYALLLATTILPLPAFPSQDGPAHLYHAKLLEALLAEPSGVESRCFMLSGAVEPNLLAHLLLLGLMKVMAPLAAEKLLVLGLLLALPLAVSFAGGARRVSWIGIWTLPLGGGYALHMGFYGFCLGTVLAFIAVGLWLRRLRDDAAQSDAKRRGLLAGLAAMLLLAALAHLFAGVASIGLCVLAALLKPTAAELHPMRLRLKRLGSLTAAALPAIALMGAYLLRQPAAPPGLPDLETALEGWRHVLAMWSFSLDELRVAQTYLLLTLALAAGLWWMRPDLLSPTWVCGMLLFFLGSLLAPDAAAGGSLLRERSQLFSLLCLPLSFSRAGSEPPPLAQAAARFLGFGAAVALALLHARSYAAHQEGLGEFLAAGRSVGPETTLLCLDFVPHLRDERGQPLSDRVDAFRHAASYLCLGRKAALLDHFAGSAPGFTVRLRPEVDPFRHFGPAALLASPPTLLPWEYEARTGVRVDHLLLWGAESSPVFRDRYAAELARRYEAVPLESPSGQLRFCRRRPQPLP